MADVLVSWRYAFRTSQNGLITCSSKTPLFQFSDPVPPTGLYSDTADAVAITMGPQRSGNRCAVRISIRRSCVPFDQEALVPSVRQSKGDAIVCFQPIEKRFC